jgi:protein-tyrosine-phosphatase
MSQFGPIVTVCTANICRSPMAGALLAHALKAQPEPLRSLNVISAGVSAHSGEKVSANSVQALKKVGLDISDHTSRPLTEDLVSKALAIFVMTESHRAMINVTFDPPPRNVHLFREFMPGAAEREIPDPFGGPLRHYEACRDEMVEAIPGLIDYLRTLTAAKA